MQVKNYLCLLFCLLNMVAIFCKQDESTEDANVDGEETSEGNQPTAAEQYLDFITSGGQNEEEYDDGADGPGGFGGVPPPDGYEEVVGNPQEEDYGLESLDLLLSMNKRIFVNN